MLLEEKTYTLKEISEWFRTSSKKLSHYKNKRFEELKQYTDFNIIYIQAERVFIISIIKVKNQIMEF